MLYQYDELSLLLVCLCDDETESSPFSREALIFLFDPSHVICAELISHSNLTNINRLA